MGKGSKLAIVALAATALVSCSRPSASCAACEKVFEDYSIASGEIAREDVRGLYRSYCGTLTVRADRFFFDIWGMASDPYPYYFADRTLTVSAKEGLYHFCAISADCLVCAEWGNEFYSEAMSL
jgi:hypothetical protein